MASPPAPSTEALEVAIETGTKRTFASALAWPGWSRSGRDEAAATQALLSYAPRYASVLRGTRLGFWIPGPGADVRVIERLPGGSGTDFGAPEAAPSVDTSPTSAADLRRARTLLEACWRAFADASLGAKGRTLRTGPRGGGRSLQKMTDHVIEAQGTYLAMLGRKLRPSDAGIMPPMHASRACLDGLAAAVRDGVPPSPRGGKRWTPAPVLRPALGVAPPRSRLGARRSPRDLTRVTPGAAEG